MGAFFGVEGLGEAGEAKFRGDVGDAGLGAGFETRLGVDEDEGAGAARAHGREQRLYTVDGAVEIGRHELVIRGEWQLGPAAARGVGAGGVDEGIDVAEAREDGGGHFSNGGVVADIAREGDEAFTSGGGRESDRLGEGVRAATDERDAPPFGGKLVDDGAADAATSAGDEGDGGWGGEGFLFHGERERGEARTWRATAIHECGGAAGENQCRLVVMPRKSELFAGSSVDLWRVVDFVSCAPRQDNLTRIRNKACASV